MVESSVGGSCRCACQEDFHELHQDQPSSTGCCSPHVFTSILLGVLSCVLMTGGVFLAFHKWDLMWLMVSGVGVILIIVGTILHCCHTISNSRSRRSAGVCGKSCCVRPLPPDHPNHMLIHNGSLTEQLLPLTNARSVSQLSLNMLPGYFPPVVTTYGIEQHSAVVQNINRLVQQQQQQQPQTNGSCSPGVSSTAGKSFIVLSLPGDTSASNIQNLLATVYQLDSNANGTEAVGTDNNTSVSSPSTAIKTNPSVLKNVEVQTCNAWPTTTCIASTGNQNTTVIAHCSTSEMIGQISVQSSVPCTSSGTTQTDEIPPSANTNLMDCSTEINPICDNPIDFNDNQSTNVSALVDIPEPLCDLLDSSLPILHQTDSASGSSRSILVDIPDPMLDGAANLASNTSLDNVTSDLSSCVASNRIEVLVDIPTNSEEINSMSNIQNSILENHVNIEIESTDNLSIDLDTNHSLAANNTILDLNSNVPGPSNVSNGSTIAQDFPGTEVLSICSNLSTTDIEIDDSELLERSSPPPSYDDVTLENEAAGAFGLAYGTI